MFLLLIPVAILYLLKWILNGIKYFISLFPKNNIRLKNIDFSEIDEMDGITFEHFIADLLKNNGFYNVQVTKSSGDFGVDVIGTKERKKWVFQCKCYKSNLGIKSIQEIYSGKKKI